jgi:hypothetical protein
VRGCLEQALVQSSKLLDQLGRLVNLELDPQHRDSHPQPAEIVVADPVLAALAVDRLERAQ